MHDGEFHVKSRTMSATAKSERPPAAPTAQGSVDYDAIVLGGGHNGLVTGAYLAAAGIRTLILEKNSRIGGAALTEEFAPGFRNSVAAYTVSLLNIKVIVDLELEATGRDELELTTDFEVAGVCRRGETGEAGGGGEGDGGEQKLGVHDWTL